MKNPDTTGRRKTGKPSCARRPSGDETPVPTGLTIPVCLGEFDMDEAREFCPLWEATWSQDARGKDGKK